jgi:hypothetical protein
MNFSEFKKLLGADPWNREPETLRARHSAPEYEQAALEAESFERKLQRAVEVTVDEELLGQLLEIPNRPVDRRLPGWVAMAASVLIVAGVAGIAWMQSQQPKTIQEYVEQHYSHDGIQLLGQASADFDTTGVAEILANFDVRAGSALVKTIRFIKFCPTMDGRGAHMVVSTELGLMQLIYMPNTRVDDGQNIRFGQMQARLVNLAAGSVAIIGDLEQAVSGMDSLVRNSFLPVTKDA